MKEMKTNLEHQVELNKNLLSQQSILRTKYDDAIKNNQDIQQRQRDLMSEIEQLHSSILILCPNKQLINPENIGKAAALNAPNVRINISSTSSSPIPSTTNNNNINNNSTLSSTPPPQMITSRTMSVPTAAALKQGVGFPLNNLRKDETGRILSTQCVGHVSDELHNECGICRKVNDQHLLAKCDTCHLYYHLGCLNPPLTRHPKKSKLYAWQCSECDKSDDSAPENVIIPKGPRRSRIIRYSKDGIIVPESTLHDSFGSDQSLALSRKSDDSFVQNITRIVTNGKSDLSPVESAEIINADSVKKSQMYNNSVTSSSSGSSVTSIIDLVKKETPKKVANREKKKVKNAPSNKQQSKGSAISISSSDTSIQLKDESVVENHTHNDETIMMNSSMSPKDNSTDDSKKPKRGRPSTKRSLSQISSDLQKHQQQLIVGNAQQLVQPHAVNEIKSDIVDLTNLSPKIECPLDKYRAFADIPNSLPYPLDAKEDGDLSAKQNDGVISINNFVANPNDFMSNGNIDQLKLTNGDGSLEYASGGSSTHHKHKKRKSHKRRRSQSPTSSGGKKHKRKHKHKDHEAPENPNAAPNTPRKNSENLLHEPRPIKMKFRAIYQAGDHKKFTWHVPNEGDEPNGQKLDANNIAPVSFIFFLYF
jgi:hypothetical protein